MSDKASVLLEYIGPPNQDWFDGTDYVTLVAGRRYPVDASLADYMVEHDSRHWKRPEPPKAAARKE